MPRQSAHQESIRSELPRLSTVVVKVGSRILAAREGGGPSRRIQSLVDDITGLKNEGVRVLLVSSGAIAHGVLALNLPRRPSAIPMQQACAGIGQIRLMHTYETLFEEKNILIGQVLVTWDDLRDKMRYFNLRNTLFQMLDFSAVPIINENDSVGVEEIRFGDNDTLGAQIALLTHADLYVNLTDTNGLYDSNPKKNKSALHIPLVQHISPEIKRLADRDGTEQGVGGMETKLRAAEMLTRAGIHAVIGDGYHHRLAEVLSDPSVRTLFLPSPKKMSSKHRWIAFAGRRNGLLIVDGGARTALMDKGKSLLPAGVKGVSGSFTMGDMVEIAGEDRVPFAAGMVNYKTSELERIMGKRSNEIAAILEGKAFDEVVHRDNLVVL
jgi:glutamate 5-kinase